MDYSEIPRRILGDKYEICTNFGSVNGLRKFALDYLKALKKLENAKTEEEIKKAIFWLRVAEKNLKSLGWQIPFIITDDGNFKKP